MTVTTLQPHNLPISARPGTAWSRSIKAVLFFILFNFGCIMVNGSQFVFLLPLRILPFQWSRRMYNEGIRYTKGAFGCLLSMHLLSTHLFRLILHLVVLMCQWFAPTVLSITFETEGMGRFTPEQIQRIVVRDSEGAVVSLNLPTKFVLIANHQASGFSVVILILAR